MHVALGVHSKTFPIDRFLNAPGRRIVTIEASGGPGSDRGQLTLSSNPNRRGGEWLIRDQFSHRHPAWAPAAGFPPTYDRNDPPYVLLFRVGRNFHARLADATSLRRVGKDIVAGAILSQSKGIRPASPALLSAFGVPLQTLLETFEEEATPDGSETFDPTDPADGRQRVFAAVLRRLGQRTFRKKLLSAYDAQCAVTRCKAPWVLEAAHITPYRGLRTNAVSNGILLRADVHTLFDLALISIEPSELTIRVSGLLAASDYAEFEGTKAVIPSRDAARPSTAALAEHFRLFHP